MGLRSPVLDSPKGASDPGEGHRDWSRRLRATIAVTTCAAWTELSYRESPNFQALVTIYVNFFGLS